MSNPELPLRKLLIGFAIAFVGLFPVLWFYAEVDVAYYWNEWESQGRPHRNKKWLLAIPIAAYAVFFGVVVRWMSGKR